MATIDEVLLKDIALIKDMQQAPDGDLQAITGERNIKEALFRRLLATPGSLVHRPGYGVGVKNYLNSLGSLANQSALAGKIKEQFELDPRVSEVSSLSFSQDDTTAGLFTIYVKVKLAGFSEVKLAFQGFDGKVL